ncbi:cyclin H [Fistulifera solaris]|uniref:Cyclin H n=1 Tax=Fistulifera solaris TaxID=1519565 RepID=A0A1Z5KCJ2_FISSO|nr:cyclin H [Fistulifera solaris]|eukprot:GAX23989.1 cyclin H [Fistulifera solaris]
MHANRKAREFITAQSETSNITPTPSYCSAEWKNHSVDDNNLPTEHEYFLTADEETTLVNFYAHKLPNLIGPHALRIRRESKITATAALFLRRFFLSNSVMLYDPKVVMVAAAFLASKVEDATVDIRQLEEGTEAMNAPVPTSDIITTEVALLQGLHFDLRCFHPYKAVVALTEDLRTFLKTKVGQALFVRNNSSNSSMISGQDLIPIYERARTLVDHVVLSDIPLLYAPGQVGMAALMLAQQQQNDLQMDLLGYLKVRFPEQNVAVLEPVLQHLCEMLSELEQQPEDDLSTLKAIHKKLKKVRVWGNSTKNNKGESKKKRRRDE